MTLSLDFLAIPLLIASGLVFISLLAGIFSIRLGFSLLLVFLIAGMLLGSDGPGGVVFEDYKLAFWVGNVALAVILLDGGLRTRAQAFRTGLKPALWLATLGVLVTAAITGAAAHWLLGLSWPMALLLGAIVGSTDAAAVFALLKSSGVKLNERVAATLELESGLNDPMAVYLTLALIGWILASAQDGNANLLWWTPILNLFQQFGIGWLIGVGAGLVFALLLRRLTIWARPPGGVRALLLSSAGLTVFALTTWLDGSGFLAIYVFGLTLANRAAQSITPAMSSMDGFAWLAQASMFLLLGLIVTPAEALRELLPTLGIVAALMLAARPIAVWILLRPMRFSNREVAFISWVGLRGAVPIVLAIFPVMAGIEGAEELVNAALIVVLASLVLQGSTIAWSARRTEVALPDSKDTPRVRQVFGDFEVPGNTNMAELCSFYGWPAAQVGHHSVAEWLTQTLGRPPVQGDHATLGKAELSVRAMDDGEVTRVGIRLLNTDDEPAH